VAKNEEGQPQGSKHNFKGRYVPLEKRRRFVSPKFHKDEGKTVMAPWESTPSSVGGRRGKNRGLEGGVNRDRIYGARAEGKTDCRLKKKLAAVAMRGSPCDLS